MQYYPLSDTLSLAEDLKKIHKIRSLEQRSNFLKGTVENASPERKEHIYKALTHNDTLRYFCTPDGTENASKHIESIVNYVEDLKPEKAKLVDRLKKEGTQRSLEQRSNFLKEIVENASPKRKEQFYRALTHSDTLDYFCTPDGTENAQKHIESIANDVQKLNPKKSEKPLSSGTHASVKSRLYNSPIENIERWMKHPNHDSTYTQRAGFFKAVKSMPRYVQMKVYYASKNVMEQNTSEAREQNTPVYGDFFSPPNANAVSTYERQNNYDMFVASVHESLNNIAPNFEVQKRPMELGPYLAKLEAEYKAAYTSACAYRSPDPIDPDLKISPDSEPNEQKRPRSTSFVDEIIREEQPAAKRLR